MGYHGTANTALLDAVATRDDSGKQPVPGVVSATAQPIINAMTVDVEDYFQVSAFDSHVSRSHWEGMSSRIEFNMERILSLFEQRGVSATFFTLGWIADRFPGVARQIVDHGHEIASHGWGHDRVTSLTQAAFLSDVSRAKDVLEDITGHRVTGYRAPSYSIDNSTPWAHEILAESGYLYSSSIAPIRHDHYGVPDAPRSAYWCADDRLLEVPISTIRFAQNNIPCGGGGWFRLYPYPLSRYCIAKINSVDAMPAVFYFHPWEIDPQQPKIHGLDFTTRFRHYVNLHSMQSKVDQLLNDFHWDRMDRVYGMSAASEPEVLLAHG